MNLTGRPIYRKEADNAENPAYLQGVRGEPCVICETWGYVQCSATTAHHPICGRYSTRRRPDEEAIPLCDGHHQGTFDTSKIAIHRERAAWVDIYGLDTEYIEATQAKLAHLMA